MPNQSNSSSATGGILAFKVFCRNAGIAPITGWRFRRKGWIETLNIAGRPYVTTREIDRFTRRAAAGEFSSEHKTPLRVKAA
jgi:hypothetical protein